MRGFTYILLALLAPGASAIDYWSCPLNQLSRDYQQAGANELGDPPTGLHWGVAPPPETGWVSTFSTRFPENFAALKPWAVVEMRRKAEEGYVLDGIQNSGKVQIMHFVQNPALIKANRAPKEPEHVAAQRRMVAEKFGVGGGTVEPIPATRQGETAPPSQPEGLAFTSQSLKDFPDGVYTFVQLEGENFLRLRPAKQGGHVATGGMESALAAGEIQLRRVDGEVQLAMTIASGTYVPVPSTLISATEAVWRQGIHPKKFFLHGPRNSDGGRLFDVRPFLDISVE